MRLLLIVLSLSLSFLGLGLSEELAKRNLRQENGISEAAPATDRDLQAWIGRQIPNNCASLYDGNSNPCKKTDPQGCGVGNYCACSSNVWGTKLVAKCTLCQYTKPGTTCPGDGFWYDKTYDPPKPIPKVPVVPKKPVAPECYGNTFGTCSPGQYCRMKSSDWTYVCAACPKGYFCSGDGRAKKSSSTTK